MCLLNCSIYNNTEDLNMSLKSASRNCIPDIVRHATVIHKAEFQADLNDMMKQKWPRQRSCTTNSTNNNNNNNNHMSKRKAKSGRGRKKAAINDESRVPAAPSQPQPASDDSMISIVDFADCVDCAAFERSPCLPRVSDLQKGPHKSKKAVHFKEEEMVERYDFTDDEESEDMRKCYWEVFARDRSRFKDRICQAADDLKLIFDSDHRQKMYNQRFLPRVDTGT